MAANGIIEQFVEAQFPPEISFGAKGGPRFHTTIATTYGGWEQRNIDWAHARCEYNVAYGLKNKEYTARLLSFARIVRGKACGFRYKDWTDYTATSEPLAPWIDPATNIASSTVYQLQKTYSFTGSSATYIRPITKPVAGTVVVVGGTGTVDTATGLVTFGSAPTTPTWTGEFDVPVRFDDDAFLVQISNYNLHDVPNIPIVEIRV